MIARNDKNKEYYLNIGFTFKINLKGSIALNILLILVCIPLMSSSLSSMTSSLTLKMPAVFAASPFSFPPGSPAVYFENSVITEKNDPKEILVKPISMNAGVCREVNCGPGALPPYPCQNMPGTIFWPSTGQCVPSFCPPGSDSEIRGARLNSGLCDPAFLGGSEEDQREELEDEFSIEDDAQYPEAEVMGGLGNRGPLGIPEADDDRPVVGPGPIPVPVPIPGVIPEDPPVEETSLPGQIPEPLLDDNTKKILLIAGVIIIVGGVLIFSGGSAGPALAPALACGGCLYE